MSIQKIVDKILSDANEEAIAIVGSAQDKSAKMLADSSLRAEKTREAVEKDTLEKVESIFEKRAADARLECAKIRLIEKRTVIDAVYALALQKLIALNKEDTLCMCKNLLEKYAETGDTVYFAENFKYGAEVERLPVCKEKGLRFAKERLAIDGGMKLVGEIADKDLSFGAMLATDKDAYQATLAKALFK